MAKKKKKSEASALIRGTKIFLDIFLSIAVVGTGGYALKEMAGRTEIVGSAEVIVTELPENDSDENAEENSETIGYTTVSVSSDDIHIGDLILVNNDYSCPLADENHLVEIGPMSDEYGYPDVIVNKPEYQIIDVAYKPMAEMMTAFTKETDLTDVMIYGSFRSNELQQRLYDEDLENLGVDESTRVAKPGFSEHETGYAIDFTTVPDFDFNGKGKYKWYSENCHKYGFVLRYPEGKEDITYIEYEPWHFRYVGIPHAVYMTRYNLCLEEYIEAITNTYSFDGIHLEIIDDDNHNYEVHYVPADTSSDTTDIPVPEDYKYTISGNNLDGFIVTVYKDSEPNVPDEESDDEDSEEETSESDKNDDEDDNSDEDESEEETEDE